MNYLMEIYNNKEIVDRKYAYTKEELMVWYRNLYDYAKYNYYLWKLEGCV